MSCINIYWYLSTITIKSIKSLSDRLCSNYCITNCYRITVGAVCCKWYIFTVIKYSVNLPDRVWNKTGACRSIPPWILQQSLSLIEIEINPLVLSFCKKSKCNEILSLWQFDTCKILIGCSIDKRFLLKHSPVVCCHLIF